MSTSSAVSFVRPKNRQDCEFLAPALEVLETPPSPVRLALIWLICAFVVTALLWAYFGRIDIISIAQGKVQPLGKTKVVQPLLTGRVTSLPPANGTRVSKGQVLIELDPTETSADVETVAQSLTSTKAEIKRRSAAIAGAHSGKFDVQVAWPEATDDIVRSREDRLLEAELLQLETSIAFLNAQRLQKEVQRDRLSETIEAQASLVSTLQDRVNMRSLLADRSAGSMANVIDATEALKEQQTQLVSQRGQLADAVSSLPILDREIDKVTRGFLADQLDKLNAAERSAQELEQRLAKALSVRRQMTLLSPIDGVVQASTITSTGQVVNSGQEVLRVVPEGEELEVEVYVANKDIGFVHPGQQAVVKFEAFPFTRYGTIQGTVTKVSTDAVPESDAGRIEGDPTAARSGSFAGVERVQNLVFPVNVKLQSTSLKTEQGIVPVSAGMAAAVEIQTGRRRIIDYLFSPLVEISVTALKER